MRVAVTKYGDIDQVRRRRILPDLGIDVTKVDLFVEPAAGPLLAGGIRQMSERGEHFLKSLAGSRAAVVGHPVPVADMGRVMFLEDVFLGSETDIAFLNTFGMRAAFDGVDLFPPREAGFIRSMAPSRIRVLGTVDPPDGASAIESLIYQCETIKIDGLKLYPPGPEGEPRRHADLLAAFGPTQVF
jgi:hypothetical protein